MKLLTNKIEIQSWLDSMDIKNYVIHDNLVVDVNGDVKLNRKSMDSQTFLLKFLPVKFGQINGSFQVANHQLSSFENFPHFVKYELNIYNNEFTTLNGMPSYIGHRFVCGDNLFTSLDGLDGTIKGELVHLCRKRNNYLIEFSQRYEKTGINSSIIHIDASELKLFIEKTKLEKLMKIDDLSLTQKSHSHKLKI